MMMMLLLQLLLLFFDDFDVDVDDYSCSDCLRICIINSCTSLFAGFAIFTYLGHMAAALDVPIEEVANSGKITE